MNLLNSTIQLSEEVVKPSNPVVAEYPKVSTMSYLEDFRAKIAAAAAAKQSQMSATTADSCI
jgi:hypothetical protein